MKLKHILAMALVVAACVPAAASTFLTQNVRDLQRRSEAVVHAQVVDIYSYWNTDRSMIFTDVTLDVKGRLHGAADRQVVVRVPGGTVGDFTVEMQGAPSFEMDEEVVAFIARWEDGTPKVEGYFQGLSQVRRDKAGNAILHGGASDGVPMSELARQLRPALQQ